jgi:hypothetical protein
MALRSVFWAVESICQYCLSSVDGNGVVVLSRVCRRPMFNVIAYRDLIAFKIKRSLLGALYQKRSLLKVLCAKTVYKRFL